MKVVPAYWERAILVCGKCSRKLDGGFGRKGKRPLAKALRDELGVGKGRSARIGVTEVKCLGVCPKGAVTLVDSAEPRRWFLVPSGESVAEVARRVLDAEHASWPTSRRMVAMVEQSETILVTTAPSDQSPAA